MNLNTMAMLQWPQDQSDENQWQHLQVLIEQLEPNQKLWLSGYLAASANGAIATGLTTPQPKTANNPTSSRQLTILYGSQTGNGESVAKQLQQKFATTDINTELLSMADLTVKQLAKKTHVCLIVSTHGEGEAPDDAEVLYEQLFSARAPDLQSLKFSVLALGDSSYELFCQTGKELDLRLAQLGAHRLSPRLDCDVDFEATANLWIEAVTPEIETEFNQENTSSDNITSLPTQPTPVTSNASNVSKHNPYQAEILTIQKITGRGSIKNTHHIELAIDPTQIQYQPGDSLGVWAHNAPESVRLLLQYWQLNGDEVFTFKDHNTTIETLLLEHIEITQISKPLVQYLAQHIDHNELQELAQSHQSFQSYCRQHQLLDLLTSFDPDKTIPLSALLQQLKGLTPRLYSIASAQSVFDDEVHLTINLDDATPAGQYGLASGLLCHQAAIGDVVKVYVEPNKNFRLPEKSETPVIMIGPGTGVAPFRSFVQHRQALQAQGSHWLIFGNPNFSTDFLYQSDWLKLQKSGHLQQLDVAFSRDQRKKIYVQDKLNEQAENVWLWLQDGAHIYVCGDATHMAKDVENSLLNIISTQGQMTEEEANTHLKALKRANRYQKDTY